MGHGGVLKSYSFLDAEHVENAHCRDEISGEANWNRRTPDKNLHASAAVLLGAEVVAEQLMVSSSKRHL